MSSIVVSRSGDFCVIVQQLLGRADDRSREPRPVQYVKNLGQNSRIRDVRAVPRQQIVYVMVSNHRDMKGVDARRSRQNCLPEYFFGDFQDRLLDRQDRDVGQCLEATLSQSRITISRFIEHVLLIVSSGVGKTHLAIALGLAASGQGRKVRFFRVTELITLLMDAKEEKQLLRLRKQIKQLDLIVLDELGLRSDREGRGRAPL